MNLKTLYEEGLEIPDSRLEELENSLLSLSVNLFMENPESNNRMNQVARRILFRDIKRTQTFLDEFPPFSRPIPREELLRRGFILTLNEFKAEKIDQLDQKLIDLIAYRMENNEILNLMKGQFDELKTNSKKS